MRNAFGRVVAGLTDLANFHEICAVCVAVSATLPGFPIDASRAMNACRS